MAIKYIDVTDTMRPGSASVMGATATITGITAANPGVVTAANTFVAGDVVAFSAVGGMVELNGRTTTVASSNGTTFTTDIDTTAFTAYTSGGVATEVMTSGTIAAARVLYDDTVSKQKLVDALQRAKEAMAELQ